MRFAAACCLSACFAAVAFAEEAPPELARVLARMAASPGVAVEFHERKELALLSAPVESRGVIYFAPPDRFARFTLAPGFSALLVSGDDVSMREGRDGEVIALAGNRMATVFVENFVALWSGDRERLERLYEVEFRSSDAAWELQLVPRRAPLADALAAITLKGDGSGMTGMAVAERDGDRTVTTFDRVEAERAFSAPELERIFAAGEPLEGVAGGH
jgi:hypothetical protein